MVQVEITFEKNRIMFKPEYTEAGDEMIFALINPNGLNPTAFSVKESDTLPVLNNCIARLANMKESEHAEYNRGTLLTFIDEAVTHREYCTPQMLRSLDDFMFHSLGNYVQYNLWDDKTLFDYNSIEKGLSASATAEDIKAIHAMIHHEKYLCLASEDKKPTLLIQVAYSLLLHLFKQDKIIKRCGNCGNLFVPTRASDKYCQRKTDGKTCGEIRKAEAQKRSHNTKEHKLYRNIDNMFLNHREYEAQEEFRQGYKACRTEKQRENYLAKWYKKALRGKPKSTI